MSLALGACRKDESKKQVRLLREEYSALLAKGTAPTSAEFDALAGKLAAIPEGADAHAEAQRLLQSIRRAQEKRPPRPLAREGAEDTPSGRERDRCVALAKKLGGATPEDRPALEKELAECRERAERLEVEENKADHPPH